MSLPPAGKTPLIVVSFWSRLATLYSESSDSFDSFVASAAASIANGWSEPVPGRELHPLESSAFHGALFRPLSDATHVTSSATLPELSRLAF
jgi:hypothetical protein